MKLYKTGIVGESHYQRAIKGCVAGDRIKVCHEPDNPYDGLALRVDTAYGETIGYIAKSSWIRDAIHAEGRGIAGTIASINRGDSGLLGVVLDVTLTDDDVAERSYQKSEPPNDNELGKRVVKSLWQTLVGKKNR